MKQILIPLLWGLGVLCWPVYSVAQPARAAVFISDTIKPYFQAAQNLESGLTDYGIELRTVEVKKLGNDTFNGVCQQLIANGYRYWVSIGPTATRLIYQFQSHEVLGRVFTMVLSPDQIMEATYPLCGVSLKIPVKDQVAELVSAFGPTVRLGILYDPANNAEFVKDAVEGLRSFGMGLKQIEVTARKEVATAIEHGIAGIDLLWMIPDQTVISESIIPYIIKGSMRKGIGVIGYNRYFLHQGAVAAFIIDYGRIGLQTAEVLRAMVQEGVCSNPDPEFELEINQSLAGMLGLNRAKADKQ